MPTPLALDPSLHVADGVQRAVYLHPTDDTKLIKVLRPAKARPVRNNFNGIMDRLLPSTRLRQIRKEYSEYLRIMLNNPEPQFHPPMSHMLGFVTTNLGLGCITERVTSADGKLGKTLGRKTKDGTFTDTDLELLNDAVSRIYKHNIRASDMNPNNFVFGQRANSKALGPEECVLVDGFGDIHAIPVRSMSKWSNRMGLDDSCKRLARNTGLVWHPTERQFAMS